MVHEKAKRPKRRAIPVRIKREVCARQGGVCVCGCGMPVSERPRTGTKFDHRPAIRLRNLSADGKDYEPHQHSAAHIDAICREEHDRRTFRGGKGARSDSTNIARERWAEADRAGRDKPKRKWKTRKFEGRSSWPPKGSRPMRGHRK